MFDLSSYLSCLLPLGNLFFILFLVMNLLFWNQQISCLVFLVISVTSSSSHSLLSPFAFNLQIPFCHQPAVICLHWHHGSDISPYFLLIRGEVGFLPDVKHCFNTSSIYLQMEDLGWSAESLGLWHGLPMWSFSSSFWGPLEDPTDSKLWIILNKSAVCFFLLILYLSIWL